MSVFLQNLTGCWYAESTSCLKVQKCVMVSLCFLCASQPPASVSCLMNRLHAPRAESCPFVGCIYHVPKWRFNLEKDCLIGWYKIAKKKKRLFGF